MASLATPNTAHALTWNWSFSGTNGSAQGTFTTAGTTAQPGVIETITGISGTYIRSDTFGAGTYSIIDLDSYQSPSNTFKWDGSSGSSLFVQLRGITFLLANFQSVNIFSRFSADGSVDDILTTFGGGDGIILSSTLSPVIDVPGPLPLFGAGAAFGWSRRLRRRVKKASLKETSLQ